MITCVVCKEVKDDDQYNWRNKARGTRKNYCRACDRVIKKRHYENNRESVIAQVRKRSQDNVDRFQAWKSTLSCTMCSESDAVCLDFHHVEPAHKDFGIGNAVPSMSWKQLMKEIEKCIVVCSNCHRKVHKYGLEYMQSKCGV